MQSLSTLAALGLAACLSIPSPSVSTPSQGASQASIEQQQRESTARSLGYPTKKSPAELEATIATQTKDFKLAHHTEGRLEAFGPFAIQGVRDTCYTVVLRLADGAAWGLGAEAGLRFDFRSPTGQGSGGPGLTGPGAVASVGCAEADGPITLTMAPLVGHDPIGQGPIKIELWSHALSRKEVAHLEADKQRQIQEQREFAAREAAEKQQRESAGCARCDARYQGCIGAGRGPQTCRSEYSSCAFENAGADYLSACPSPR